MNKTTIKEIRKVNTGDIEINYDVEKEIISKDFHKNNTTRFYVYSVVIPKERFKDLIKAIKEKWTTKKISLNVMFAEAKAQKQILNVFARRKMEMAITHNLIFYAQEMGLKVDNYKDRAERQIIGKVDISKEQYEKLFNIAEQIGGFICRFNHNLSQKV